MKFHSAILLKYNYSGPAQGQDSVGKQSRGGKYRNGACPKPEALPSHTPSPWALALTVSRLITLRLQYYSLWTVPFLSFFWLFLKKTRNGSCTPSSDSTTFCQSGTSSEGGLLRVNPPKNRHPLKSPLIEGHRLSQSRILILFRFYLCELRASTRDSKKPCHP